MSDFDSGHDLRSWDRVLHWGPRSVGNLLSLSFYPSSPPTLYSCSLSLSQINKIFLKRKETGKEEEKSMSLPLKTLPTTGKPQQRSQTVNGTVMRGAIILWHLREVRAHAELVLQQRLDPKKGQSLRKIRFKDLKCHLRDV